jgi:hypothetical protein
VAINDLSRCHPILQPKVAAILRDVNGHRFMPKGLRAILWETARSVEQQRIYFKRGTSKTMNSKHLIDKATGYCYAADIIFEWNGNPTWNPVQLTNGKNPWDLITSSAETHGLKRLKNKKGIVWDMPHVELTEEAIKYARLITKR